MKMFLVLMCMAVAYPMQFQQEEGFRKPSKVSKKMGKPLSQKVSKRVVTPLIQSEQFSEQSIQKTPPINPEEIQDLIVNVKKLLAMRGEESFVSQAQERVMSQELDLQKELEESKNQCRALEKKIEVMAELLDSDALEVKENPVNDNIDFINNHMPLFYRDNYGYSDWPPKDLQSRIDDFLNRIRLITNIKNDVNFSRHRHESYNFVSLDNDSLRRNLFSVQKHFANKYLTFYEDYVNRDISFYIRQDNSDLRKEIFFKAMEYAERQSLFLLGKNPINILLESGKEKEQ